MNRNYHSKQYAATSEKIPRQRQGAVKRSCVQVLAGNNENTDESLGLIYAVRRVVGSNAGVLLLEAAVPRCNNGNTGYEAMVYRRLMATVKCYCRWTVVTAIRQTTTNRAASHRWQRPRIRHTGILIHPSRTTRLPNPNAAEFLFPFRPQPWLRFQLPSRQLSRHRPRPRPQPRSQPRPRRIAINVPILLAFRTNNKVWLNIKAAKSRLCPYAQS